jgi:hypothetical protein
VSTIALLCFVLLCTPVQLACSLAALQADLLFTPVNTCSVYSLEALQANFEDPFLGPPTPCSQCSGDRVRVVGFCCIRQGPRGGGPFYDQPSGPQQYFSTKLPTAIQVLGSRPAEIHVFVNFARGEVCTVSL